MYYLNKIRVAMLVSLLAFGFSLTSCASSTAKQALMSATSVEEVPGLSNKLTWLQKNAVSGGNYVIEIDSDEVLSSSNPFSYKGYLSYKGRSNITITLKGVMMTAENFERKTRIEMEEKWVKADAIERFLKSDLFKSQKNAIAESTNSKSNWAISRDYNDGSVFIVGSGVTLILDNIKIQPGSKTLAAPPSRGALVAVSKGGTFVMNDGSIIIFNTNKFDSGGGVHVSFGATFIMKGGIITSNTCFPIPNAAMIAASGGKYNAVSDKQCNGGGVYVSGGGNIFGKAIAGGTFIKSGGTITGYADDSGKGNEVRDFASQNIVHNSGHAVYAGSKRKESTAGPEVNLYFSDDKISGGWD